MIRFDRKLLLAKIETTYGTDSTPTGAANAILANNIRLSPMEGNDLSRDLEKPTLGADPSIPIDLHAKLMFNVELAGSGTAGTAPAWGPILRACAVAEVITPNTSVVYTPISDGHEAITIYLWIGNTQYSLTGARGTATIRINAQAIPYLEFEMTGLFVAPKEAARPSQDLTAFQKPLAGTAKNTPVFTIGGASFVMRQFALNLGNQVETRFLIDPTEGERILIVNRAESVETSVEAVALSTFDPYAQAVAQADLAVQLVHGTVAGNIARIDISKAQVQRTQGLENAQEILEWPLRFLPLATAGDDQWSLTLT